MPAPGPFRRLRAIWRWPRRPLPYLAGGLLLAITLRTLADWLDLGLVRTLAAAMTWAFGLLIVGTLFMRVLRRFLWRVGRRLAFSYFLIGVLPIPLVALLTVLVTGMMAGFFLGHLYRDAVDEHHRELVAVAAQRLATASARPPTGAGVVLADYRGGRRVGNDERFPAAWPDWLPAGAPPGHDASYNKETVQPFVALADGRPALAGSAGDGERGTIALFTGDLEEELSERADVWVGLRRSDDPGAGARVRVQIGSVELPIGPAGGTSDEAKQGDDFFARRARSSGILDRPIIVWGEVSRPYVFLADGAPAAEHVLASLAASPRLIHRHLFSSDAEINTAAWAATVVVAFLLFDIYLVAVLMAAFLSFGLTRAVNRLSGATAAVGRGDFSVRIPVRRKDQVGDLQRSFNQMTGHLQELVATAAQKEALDAELDIARRLQKSLLPSRAPAAAPDNLDFSTYFEPSAAIGGDYFDILRLADGRLAVIIADVSGHGLPAGLRMAMLKAALQVLVEDQRSGEEILRRLDAMVRSAEGPRSFVTATLAVVDPRDGAVELINAGHPPTYRLSADGDRVEEILLPSSALGGLGTEHGRRHLELAPGETLVWLSDGLIEAADAAGNPFGYDRVLAALRGAGDARSVRDRLLDAVRRHSAGRGVEDDRTLVVLRYVGMPSEA